MFNKAFTELLLFVRAIRTEIQKFSTHCLPPSGPWLFWLLCCNPAIAAPSADQWVYWIASDPHNQRHVDHAIWQTFLDDYLLQPPDGINRLAYQQVTASDRGHLHSYLKHLSSIDPRWLHKDEQLPYWINFYNALTVAVVLRYPDKNSIQRMGEQFFAVGPWDDPVATVAGKTITLNDIEHRILRPIWQDHRIHYALNCASIGCPNLSQQVYTRDTVQQQLASAETAYINHARGVSFDQQGRLKLSSIFQWYQVDFAEDESTLLTYLATHHLEKNRLKRYAGTIQYDYDWSLNRAE